MSELIIGNKARLKIETTVASTTSFKFLATEVSCGLDLSTDKIDMTHKDNGNWKASIPGMSEGTVPFEAFAEFSPAAGTLGYAQLLQLAMGKATHNFQLAFDVTNDVTIEFPGWIDGFKTEASVNNGVKVSFNIVVTAEPELTIAS